jgi:hypothetical protein
MPKVDVPLSIVVMASPSRATFQDGQITVRLLDLDDKFSTLRWIDGAGAIHDWCVSLPNLRLLADELRAHLFERARLAVRPPRNHAATGRRT